MLLRSPLYMMIAQRCVLTTLVLALVCASKDDDDDDDMAKMEDVDNSK